VALVEDTVVPSSRLEPAVIRNVHFVRRDAEVELNLVVANTSLETVPLSLRAVVSQDLERG
jgi:hypothetical protein